MLSVRVSSLTIDGQIFNYVKVSTQYDFIFGCDLTFQLIKENFSAVGVCSQHICSLFKVCFFVFLR